MDGQRGTNASVWRVHTDAFEQPWIESYSVVPVASEAKEGLIDPQLPDGFELGHKYRVATSRHCPSAPGPERNTGVTLDGPGSDVWVPDP